MSKLLLLKHWVDNSNCGADKVLTFKESTRKEIILIPLRDHLCLFFVCELKLENHKSTQEVTYSECVCPCVHALMCAHGVYREAHPCAVLKAEAREHPVSSFTALYVISLKQDRFLKLKLAISVRLADQWAFEIHLSPSPRVGAPDTYGHTWLFFLFFSRVLGILIQVLTLTHQLLLLTELPPQLTPIMSILFKSNSV